MRAHRTAGRPRVCRAGTLRDVASPDRLDHQFTDDDRVVDLADDDVPVLPDQTRDDTDSGWGEPAYSNDDRLLGDRPPHWD